MGNQNKDSFPIYQTDSKPIPPIDSQPENEAEIHCENRAKRNGCYNFFYQIVISVTFNFLIYCFILANTITLALYRFD